MVFHVDSKLTSIRVQLCVPQGMYGLFPPTAEGSEQGRDRAQGLQPPDCLGQGQRVGGQPVCLSPQSPSELTGDKMLCHYRDNQFLP